MMDSYRMIYENNLCVFNRNIFQKKISLRGILLYLYLLSICNSEKEFDIDFELVEAKLKFTKGTVKTYLKELESHNLIIISCNGNDMDIEIVGVTNE